MPPSGPTTVGVTSVGATAVGAAAVAHGTPDAPLSSLGAAHVVALVAGFRDALRANQAAVNRLNVYPVPDGDTGTNMALTVESVVAEVAAAAERAGAPSPVDADMATVCQAVAHGSLMGARGNSGVILSQVLRGLAGAFREQGSVDGPVFAAALAAAATAAYGAVMRPIEGTILTVVREAGEAATDAATPGAALRDVLVAARTRAGEALARTPELLPVLAAAGVVDAGGAGFCLLLDAALLLVEGRPVPVVEAPGSAMAPDPTERPDAHAHEGDHGNVADLRYEVMYFLEAPDESVGGFKDAWAAIGDSIVVVGGDGIFNCHIHTNDIGAAIEAAIDIGRPRNIRVTDLFEEVEEERWVREATGDAVVEEPPHATEPCETAVVAVATGEGIRRLFLSLGVQRVVTGGQSMNPSTAQLLEAVEAAPADSVVILPNNKNIIPVAEQVDALTAKKVVVVPTRGISEGLAAAMQYDPEGDVASVAGNMRTAGAAVVSGEITVAVRDSTCDAGPIAEGDHLGIAREGIVTVAPDLVGACTGLLDRLLEGAHEIVTVIEGDGASAASTRHITEWLADHHPDVAVEVHHGGQPLYPYLFGIE